MSQASAASSSGINPVYGTDLAALTPVLIAVAVVVGIVALLWLSWKK